MGKFGIPLDLESRERRFKSCYPDLLGIDVRHHGVLMIQSY